MQPPSFFAMVLAISPITYIMEEGRGRDSLSTNWLRAGHEPIRVRDQRFANRLVVEVAVGGVDEEIGTTWRASGRIGTTPLPCRTDRAWEALLGSSPCVGHQMGHNGLGLCSS